VTQDKALKTKANLNYMQYREVITIRIGNAKQSVNAVQSNSPCLFPGPYKAQKYTPLTKGETVWC
jgi:hypothetical protein